MIPVTVFDSIKRETIDGNEMVWIPKFYYRCTTRKIPTSSKELKEYNFNYDISIEPMDGFALFPAFYNAGKEIDGFYFPCYHASKDKNGVPASVAGADDWTDITKSDAVKAIKGLGDAYHLESFWEHMAVAVLMMVDKDAPLFFLEHKETVTAPEEESVSVKYSSAVDACNNSVVSFSGYQKQIDNKKVVPPTDAAYSNVVKGKSWRGITDFFTGNPCFIDGFIDGKYIAPWKDNTYTAPTYECTHVNDNNGKCFNSNTMDLCEVNGDKIFVPGRYSFAANMYKEYGWYSYGGGDDWSNVKGIGVFGGTHTVVGLPSYTSRYVSYSGGWYIFYLKESAVWARAASVGTFYVMAADAHDANTGFRFCKYEE